MMEEGVVVRDDGSDERVRWRWWSNMRLQEKEEEMSVMLPRGRGSQI